MKKTLLMGALALAIVTSMVAGTLAVYSKNFSFEGNVTAKTFYVNASAETTNPDIQIAPGETVDWEFKVTNTSDDNAVSAVDMSTKIVVALPTGFEDIAVLLLDENGNTLGKGVADQAGTIEIDGANFTANTSQTNTYTLQFIWDGTHDANDTQLGETGTTSPFTVTVTGTQR